MKPIYASLRNIGHINSGYIDDSILMGDTNCDCKQNVEDTVQLMEKVGFMIHPDKSVLIPCTKIAFLGNDIDSVKMIVTLPESKMKNLVSECKMLFKMDKAKIQYVARVVGLMVSSFSAVELGRLYYRSLEKGKIEALKINKGQYYRLMPISREMKTDLEWWIDNLHSQKRDITHGNPGLIISTDASLEGWGAVCNGLQ